MAAPKFAPLDPTAHPRGYESPPYVPDRWVADRPAEVDGRQPTGRALGYQGPDQGYALTLASRVRPKLQLAPGESADDAIAGVVSIATRRASLYGRAPVMHDLTIALTAWGFLDPSPPAELVAKRRELFMGVGSEHGYFEARHIADMVPESTLRLTPDEANAAYPANWRELTGA
jgi:hypothetical protein